MRMPEKFIISPLNGEKFINTKKIGDKELIINTSIEHASNVNRIGVVEALPLNYESDIKVGDHVIVQHNVFRTYFDGQGKTRESDFYITKNLFQVMPELIYLIIRGEQKISVDKYVFIKPITINKKWVGEVEQEHVGIVVYSNKVLEKLGINVGDKIAFEAESEYEFNIYGQKLYRVRTKCILAKLDS
jgi:co-chaperonin GroES (HSP10)